MWKCSKCSYINEDNLTECENCYHIRRSKKSMVKPALMMLVVCVALISLAFLLAMSGKYDYLTIKEKVKELESGKCGVTNSLEWHMYSDNTLVISGSGRMENFEKRGDCQWRSYLEQTRKIVIEDGVLNIGVNAFNGSGAKEVLLADSVGSIEKLAFANCVNLKSITIPSGVGKIGESAFIGCLYLKQANIDSQTEEIAQTAFDMCHSEFKIIAPEGSAASDFSAGRLGIVPEIEKVEFDEELDIAEMGECGEACVWTLYDDGRLIIEGEGNINDASWNNYLDMILNIEIKEGIGLIGERVFENCINLKSAKINCKTIGNAAFYGCEKLESVDICSGAEDILEEAFVKCKSLKKIYIPPSVKQIKYNAFKENHKELKICGDTRSYARFYALIKFISFREEKR